MRFHDRLPVRWTGVVRARHQSSAVAWGPEDIAASVLIPRIVTLLAASRPLVPGGIVLPPGVPLPAPGTLVRLEDLPLTEPVDLSIRAGPHQASLPEVGPVYPARLAAFVAGLLRGEADPLPLCGLGPGSTPLGDDLMVGVLAGLWRVAPHLVPDLGDLRSRTTPTSAEMLRHATANAFPEPLAELVNRLDATKPPVQPLLELGASSGAAMLAGLRALLIAC